jgi:hypothetical protein
VLLEFPQAVTCENPNRLPDGGNEQHWEEPADCGLEYDGPFSPGAVMKNATWILGPVNPCCDARDRNSYANWD